MRHFYTMLFLFTFAVLMTSPLHVEAGVGNSPPPAQAAPPANAPRAGAAQNPGSPQAGPREQGDGIVEERREEMAYADLPPAAGRTRYSFNVPVNVEDVPEGNGLHVKCTLARRYFWKEGSPVSVDKGGIFAAVYGAKPVPLRNGAFRGNIVVNVDGRNDRLLPLARFDEVRGHRENFNTFHYYRCQLMPETVEAYSARDAGQNAWDIVDEQAVSPVASLCSQVNLPEPRYQPKAGARCVDFARGQMKSGTTNGEPRPW